MLNTKKIKNYAYFFMLFMTMTTLVTSCKKYEDGPFISFRTRKERVVNSWKFSQALYNGLEVTNGTIDTSINYSKSSIGFDDAGRFSLYLVQKDSGSLQQNGNWFFQKKDEELLLEFDNGSSIVWEILKLKEQELHIRQELDGNNTFIFKFTPTTPIKKKFLGIF